MVSRLCPRASSPVPTAAVCVVTTAMSVARSLLPLLARLLLCLAHRIDEGVDDAAVFNLGECVSVPCCP